MGYRRGQCLLDRPAIRTREPGRYVEKRWGGRITPPPQTILVLDGLLKKINTVLNFPRNCA